MDWFKEILLIAFLISLIGISYVYANEQDRIIYATRIESQGNVQTLKIYSGGVIEFNDGEKMRTYKQVKEQINLKGIN